MREKVKTISKKNLRRSKKIGEKCFIVREGGGGGVKLSARNEENSNRLIWGVQGKKEKKKTKGKKAKMNKNE